MMMMMMMMMVRSFRHRQRGLLRKRDLLRHFDHVLARERGFLSETAAVMMLRHYSFSLFLLLFGFVVVVVFERTVMRSSSRAASLKHNLCGKERESRKKIIPLSLSLSGPNVLMVFVLSKKTLRNDQKRRKNSLF